MNGRHVDEFSQLGIPRPWGAGVLYSYCTVGLGKRGQRLRRRITVSTDTFRFTIVGKS